MKKNPSPMLIYQLMISVEPGTRVGCHQRRVLGRRAVPAAVNAGRPMGRRPRIHSGIDPTDSIDCQSSKVVFLALQRVAVHRSVLILLIRSFVIFFGKNS